MAAKQKIMIVDDDNNIAELIALYLNKECFDTRIVGDGEAALRSFDSFAPNLILLDLIRSLDWNLVQTTISSNLLTPRSWWPGSKQCCAVFSRTKTEQTSPKEKLWTIRISLSIRPTIL